MGSTDNFLSALAADELTKKRFTVQGARYKGKRKKVHATRRKAQGRIQEKCGFP
jgi:hypothetical protein